jgi:UDP-N-acetylmuramoyl-L-alanyl-D-glutamate--2,6-diaminopimelate ligase
VTWRIIYATKRQIFTFEYSDLAVINIDSSYGARLQKECEIPQITLSLHERSADWHVVVADEVEKGFQVAIRGKGGILIETIVPLHGDYNLENALMAIALAVESGMDPIDIARIAPTLTGAPGRLQPVEVGQRFTALVDYAHSPDAVERVLETARKILKARNNGGKIIAVLGCGGDRDATKRAPMGRALLVGSDVAIFTSDNPRSETPDEILRQMCNGLAIAAPHQVIIDRGEAIEKAVAVAEDNDILLVLGKGHEQGQEIAGVKHPFDDRVILANAIAGTS